MSSPPNETKRTEPRNTEVVWPWELPERMSGVAVVTDIFAATSNITWFLAHNVHDLIIVNKENVLAATEQYPQALVIGDKSDLNLAVEFASSNHPSKVAQLDVSGKTILYITNNGARVIEEAYNKSAHTVLAASFGNIDAVSYFLKKRGGETITLLPAGERTMPDTIPDWKAREDLMCALALSELIIDGQSDLQTYVSTMITYIRSVYTYDKTLKEADIKLVSRTNQYQVVPICNVGDDGYIHVTDALTD